jgi:Acetyl xylan esterase (AXE1)
MSNLTNPSNPINLTNLSNCATCPNSINPCSSINPMYDSRLVGPHELEVVRCGSRAFVVSRYKRVLHIILIGVVATCPAWGQTPRQPFSRVVVRVAPDRPGWTYQPGEPAAFRIDVLRDGHPVQGAPVQYSFGPEMLPPTTTTMAVLDGVSLTVAAGTLTAPGFLRLVATVDVDGHTYRGVGTAGFAPELIAPTQSDPADFDAFWADGRARLAALPVDAKWTPLPEYGMSGVDCWQVNLQNIGVPEGASRLYGVLCIPTAARKYPALLSVPGAGVRPYRGLAELAARGLITLQIGTHGLPVTSPQEVYDGLRSAALNGYPTFGLDDRDRYYYRREPLLRRRQFRSTCHGTRPLLLGIQRRDLSADVDVRGVQRHSRAEAPDARVRHRSSRHAGTDRRRGGLAHQGADRRSAFSLRPSAFSALSRRPKAEG